MSDSRLVLAHIPRGQALDLVGAVGGLLDAALNGGMMATSENPYAAADIIAPEGQDVREVVALLRAASRRIGKRPHRTIAEDQPEFPDDGIGIGQFTKTETGVQIGLTGSTELAAEMAKQLLAAFIPAMEEMGAENYLSWDCVDQTTGGRYTLTVGKPGGASPHEKRLEAEAECVRLRALLEEHGVVAGGAA